MDKLPPGWDKQQIKKGASFLQSAGWAQFQASLGAIPHFLQGDGWSCLLIEKRNRVGKYLFSQYGPVVDSEAALKKALAQITSNGRQLGVAWISLEPMSGKLPADSIKKIMGSAKAKPAARHREPDLTRIIDLSPPADDLLASLSQSTRSFIRKNQRENFISFKTSTEPADITIFTKMLGAVSERKNVYFYSDEYFKKQAQVLMPRRMMFLEMAIFNGQPVASAIFHDFGMFCTYTFAGSLPHARDKNASALLLWQAILNAKARGVKKMDLYGIAPDNAKPSHPWIGFSSFKAKFGGQVEQYAGTWDISLNYRYKIYRGAHQTRRLLKRH